MLVNEPKLFTRRQSKVVGLFIWQFVKVKLGPVAPPTATPFVLHDLQNPQKDPLTIPKAHPSSLWSASFDPDNRSLVTSGNDGLIKFWNLETAKVALTLEHSHGPHVRIAFSEDGNLLVSMDSLGTAKLWRAAKASDRP